MAKSTQTGQLLTDYLNDSATLSPETAWSIMRQLVDQVEQLHSTGQLHRKIGPNTIWITRDDRATLQPPVTEYVDFATSVSTELLPSDLEDVFKLHLPYRIDQAEETLKNRGILTDPRRIDLFLIGKLALEVLTRDSVANYLMRPQVKAAVPAPWRVWIDRSLGFAANDRVERCEQLQVALADMTPEQADNNFEATPPVGTGVDVHRDTPLHGSQLPENLTNTDLPFTQLGQYRIDAKLGSGGMGDVYRGYDPRLDREVAIKVLPPALAHNTDFVGRFMSEARAAAKLVHPHIVPIYFIGEDHGTHFFAMQYVDGPSLAALLKRRGTLSAEESIKLVSHVAAGLEEAHSQGLIHRDIKPGNILIDAKTKLAKLADFGLVKSLGSSIQATATGVVMGTVDYIAPEQGRGEPVDGRADLYSLGVLLYHVLSGELPFVADSPTAMIFQHAYEHPTPLDELVSDLPAGLEEIVECLMQKAPDDRYQSAAALIEDLQAVRKGREPQLVKRQPTAAAPATQIILAPEFDTIDQQATEAFVPQIKQGWRTRLLAAFNQHAPQSLKDLQNTQLQVDGSIAIYTKRRNELAALATEARAVEKELSKNVAEQEAAAKTAAQQGDASQAELHRQTLGLLQTQLLKQKEQTEQIDMRLARVDTTLQKLRSQQQLLVARLETARGALPEPSKRRHRTLFAQLNLRHPLTIILAVVLGLSCLLLSFSVLGTLKSPNNEPTADSISINSSTSLVASKSLDLLPLIDVQEDTISGVWKRSGAGVTRIQKSGGSRSLVVPVTIDGSFELLATYQVKSGAPECAVGFQLPFGNGHGMVVFGRKGKRINCGINGIHGLSAGDPQNPTQNSAYKHTTGINHEIRIRGNLNSENVHIQVWENEQILMDWIGRQDDVRSGLKADRKKDKRLVLSSWGNTAIFSRLHLRMLDGKAVVLREQGSTVPTAVSSLTGTWQMNLLSGAQRGITLVSISSDNVLFRAGGVFDGKYHWDGTHLVIHEPMDKRFVGLVWQRDGSDLVLVDEPPDHPAGPSYVGARLKFISSDTSSETRMSVEELPSGAAKEYSLRFNKESRYILSNSLSYNGSHPLTVEAWVKSSRSAHGHAICLFAKNQVAMLQLRLQDHVWSFNARDYEHELSTMAKSEFPTQWDIWTHLAGVYDGVGLILYVNGEKAAETSTPKEFKPQGSLLRVGSDTYIRDTVFEGNISQIRISNNKRYTSNFQPPNYFASDENTMVLYRLNEGKGAVAIDASGNGRHGTIRVPQWEPETQVDQPDSFELGVLALDPKKNVLVIGPHGPGRGQRIVDLCKAYGLQTDLVDGIDPTRKDYSDHHTIIFSSNYLDRFEKKSESFSKPFADFVKHGGHLFVFGSWNGRGAGSLLGRYGIKVGTSHSDTFARTGLASDLLFQGNEHLIPEGGHLRSTGHIFCNRKYVALLNRGTGRNAGDPKMITMSVGNGRVSFTQVEPYYDRSDWIVEPVVSWISRGAPIPLQVPTVRDDSSTSLNTEGIKSSTSITGTWQINFNSGAQRGVTLQELPDGTILLRATGVMDGLYRREGDRLIVIEPNDRRYQGLIWQLDQQGNLVLVEEPPNRPSGQSYVGVKMKFVSGETSNEARTKVQHVSP